jgi:hypothetical protein
MSADSYSVLIRQKTTLFSGHYLRNRSTLDISVLGYIGILYHKEHSPEVWHNPPGTPCIYSHSFVHTYIHTYVHIFIHKYTLTYIHAYIHTHTHTHTYMCVCVCIHIYMTVCLKCWSQIHVLNCFFDFVV